MTTETKLEKLVAFLKKLLQLQLKEDRAASCSVDSNVAADILSLQSRLAGRQKSCRLLRAAFSSYAAACTIAAVTKKSLGTCKGVARSSTDTYVAFANGR